MRKISLLLLLVVLAAGSVWGEVVEIEDATLEASIRQALELGKEETITDSHLVNLTELVVVKVDSLASLSGLEYAINLQKLFVEYMFVDGHFALSNLAPLSGLDKLQQLGLVGCQIEDISPLAGLSKLIRLDLRRNRIVQIPDLSALQNLVDLDLSQNQLTQINGLEGVKVYRLDLSDNQIENITALSKINPHLLKTRIDLSHNLVTDLQPLVDISDLSQIEQIDVRDNPLSQISLETHIPSLVQDSITVLFVAPESAEEPIQQDSTFYIQVAKGINFVSLPLKQIAPTYARDLLSKLNATLIIRYNRQDEYFQGYTEKFPGSGFEIEGGRSYIVNSRESQIVSFTGKAWSNTLSDVFSAAPISTPTNNNTWAFMVNVDLASNENLNFSVKNLRTDHQAQIAQTQSSSIQQAIWADWSRQSVVEVGDLIEISIHDQFNQQVGIIKHHVSQSDINQAYVEVEVKASDILPGKTQLLTNYPNPFNPETWIPYQLNSDSEVTIGIYGMDGNLVRQLDVGYQPAGYYHAQSRAAYWDGRNNIGEQVVSGIYFYQLLAGDYTATKKMVILK